MPSDATTETAPAREGATSQAAHAAPPAEAAASAGKPGLGGRISSFLGQIAPYRELIALIVGVVAAISASISWTVSHFATQAQLTSLDCKTDTRLNSDSFLLKNFFLTNDENTANGRLSDLNKVATKTAGEEAEAEDLSAEISSDIQQISANEKQIAAQSMVVKCTTNGP